MPQSMVIQFLIQANGQKVRIEALKTTTKAVGVAFSCQKSWIGNLNAELIQAKATHRV